MNRRDVLKAMAAGAAAGVVGTSGGLRPAGAAPAIGSGKSRRPNVLFICTDQQHAGMMSCAGNRWVDTPAMDWLAEHGTRFENAYCTQPVCVPSRMSMVTGRYAAEMATFSNYSKQCVVPEHFVSGALGHAGVRAGYDVGYGGKVHLPAPLKLEKIGFDNYITKDERDDLATEAAKFIRQRRDKPFFLVASFINPHDICYMGIRAHPTTPFEKILVKNGGLAMAELDKALKLPDGVDRERFFREMCPPLPTNYPIDPAEPEAIGDYARSRPFMHWIRENWSDETWRMHRWAYARLTERVDGQIQKVLKALQDSGQAENTVVIFTSDHGDNDAARRLEHKSMPYEESTNVPWLVCQKGTTTAGAVNSSLISSGLDLIPTVCDYMGIEAPEGLAGRSVRGLAEGTSVRDWRTEVVTETEVGPMIRNARYKYCLFAPGANRYQMFDLQADPFETRNIVDDPKLADTRRELHAKLEAHIARTGYKFPNEWPARPGAATD